MKMIAINDAELADLRSYARNVLNIEVSNNLGRDRLISKISDIEPNIEEIHLPDGEGGNAADNKTPAEQATEDSNKVRIRIHETEDDEDAVPISVNGRAMFIPKGKDVDIPRKYFEALDNAKVIKYAKGRGREPGDAAISRPTKVHLYPFSVINPSV